MPSLMPIRDAQLVCALMGHLCVLKSLRLQCVPSVNQGKG